MPMLAVTKSFFETKQLLIHVFVMTLHHPIVLLNFKGIPPMASGTLSWYDFIE